MLGSCRRGGGFGSMGEGRPEGTGTIVPRSALRGRWGGGGEAGRAASWRPSIGLALSVGRPSGSRRPRRSRGGGSAAGRGARGLTRPGWRGRGRHGGPPRERLGGGGGGGEAHIRASEQQAGGGHIDIDPLARYEMAHWPAMAAACFTPPRSAWDWRERQERRPGRKCRRLPRGSGRGALRWVLPAWKRAFGPPRR